MSEDALDVYVEPVPEQRVTRRRHVAIADADWQQVGDPASTAGTRGRLRARLAINGTPVDVEMVLADDGPSVGSEHQEPELRVHGQMYRLVGIFAVDGRGRSRRRTA